MARQLVLIDPRDTDWQIDEHTRQVGREGLADARRQLQEAIKRAAA